jgi:hypothetical protein
MPTPRAHPVQTEFCATVMCGRLCLLGVAALWMTSLLIESRPTPAAKDPRETPS